MIKKILAPDVFFASVLFPLMALTLYCYSFAYISSIAFLEGVNYSFSWRLAQYLSFAVAGAVFVFLALIKFGVAGTLAFRHSGIKFLFGEFLLIFLPLTPVAQYIINNQGILSISDSLYVLMFFASFSGLYMFVVPAVFRSLFSTRAVMLMGLAFAFTIINMASLSARFAWFERGALKIQVLVLGGVFLGALLLHNFDKRILYCFVAINFIANSSFHAISQYRRMSVSTPVFEENQLVSLVAGRMPANTPSIYLLVYDAYVPNETTLAYGIDNRAQEDYLQQQGFALYPHTYSIGSTSLETMSRVINVSSGFYGDQRRGVSGDGAAHKILKDIGYDTYGLFYSDYMFRGYGESYDVSIPEYVVPSYMLLSKAILIGEFRFNIEEVGFDAQPHDQFVQSKQSILGSVSNHPVFVYMHTNLPAHSQNSGDCLSDEVDQFQARLIQANIEMGQDVDLIIENDPGAIVIVAGDHGPYLTKNCTETNGEYDISEISRLDIQDRYATFLAIRWPGGDETYADIVVLQDLFPAVFAYLYGDPLILQSKIEPIIPLDNHISGASVDDGIIVGGIDDGEPLFLSEK